MSTLLPGGSNQALTQQKRICHLTVHVLPREMAGDDLQNCWAHVAPDVSKTALPWAYGKWCCSKYSK